MKNDKSTNGMRASHHFLLILIPLAIYFFLGLNHISQFMTADEHFWFYDRIPQYWEGLLGGNLKETYINDKPGITVALVSGAGLIWENNPRIMKIQELEPPDGAKPQIYEKLSIAFRLPILIFNGLFSFYFYWILLKITKNKWLSLAVATMILLCPILLGISQIANPDSLLWVFGSATILSFIAYLNSRERKMIFLSSLFLALSLLSKYSMTLLFPFLFLMTMSHIFISSDFKDLKNNIKALILGYFSAILGSVIIFSLLMPAVFVKWKYLWQGTFGYPGMPYIMVPILISSFLILADAFYKNSAYAFKLAGYLRLYHQIITRIVAGLLALIFIVLIINGLSGWDFLRIHEIPFDIRQDKAFIKNTSLIQKIFLEFRQLVFSLTPLAVASLLWLWIRSAFNKMPLTSITLPLSIFYLVYYTAILSQGLLANIRYSIILYPITMILAGIGLFDFIKYFKIIISNYFVYFGLIVVCIISIWLSKPFYFNYTSSLLPQRYIITGAWGYGGYEAAQYLNHLPEPEKIRVWADYQGVCEFFKGQCMTKNFEYDQSKYSFDYFVFSRRGQILDAQKKAFKKPVKEDPEWELFIGGREENFVKVYKAK